MKNGFTLIELMVVVGIMAFLGVAATGGYSALQKGMAERGATAAASSLLQAAKERAMVDRSPTVVYCYNRMVKEATDIDNAVIVGEAVAVRRSGRISYVRGKYLVDEFMDVVGSYDIIDDNEVSKRKGMRLWRFDDKEPSGSDMKYSVVADAVIPLDQDTLQLHTFDNWAKAGEDVQVDEWEAKVIGGRSRSEKMPSTMPYVAYAFYNLGSSSHEPSSWVAGNGYGFEFAKMQLPKNFIFEKDVPSRLGDVKLAKTLYFTPEAPNDDKTVNVYFCRPQASGLPKANDRPAGQASSKENQKI